MRKVPLKLLSIKCFPRLRRRLSLFWLCFCGVPRGHVTRQERGWERQLGWAAESFSWFHHVHTLAEPCLLASLYTKTGMSDTKSTNWNSIKCQTSKLQGGTYFFEPSKFTAELCVTGWILRHKQKQILSIASILVLIEFEYNTNLNTIRFSSLFESFGHEFSKKSLNVTNSEKTRESLFTF